MIAGVHQRKRIVHVDTTGLICSQESIPEAQNTKEVEMSVKARLDEEKEIEIGENREDR